MLSREVSVGTVGQGLSGQKKGPHTCTLHRHTASQIQPADTLHAYPTHTNTSHTDTDTPDTHILCTYTYSSHTHTHLIDILHTYFTYTLSIHTHHTRVSYYFTHSSTSCTHPTHITDISLAYIYHTHTHTLHVYLTHIPPGLSHRYLEPRLPSLTRHESTQHSTHIHLFICSLS